MRLITKIYRGSVVESFHMGYAYATDETGKEIFAVGNPETPLFTQETAAPFKLASLIQEKGDEKYNISDNELAVTCSTHNGKDVHTDVIHSLLKKIDVTIGDLQCNIENPNDKSNYEKLIIQGRRASQIHNTFSGLHAGSAALAKTLGEEPKEYLHAISLTHNKNLENIKKYAECDKVLTEIDDSGLDTYYLPMKNITRMYRNLISGSDETLTKVFQVVTDFPEMIAGEGEFDTEFIKLMKGNGLAKSGTNGLVTLCVKSPKSSAVNLVVKSIDGSTKAAVSMALEILKHLEGLNKKSLDKLKDFHCPQFINGAGNKTGYMETEIITE